MDVSFLTGACVRDVYGKMGRLVRVDDQGATILWETPGSIVGREERLSVREDRRGPKLEVLTLSDGWVFLDSVLPTFEETETKKKQKSIHNPFRHEKELGPGPRGERIKAKKRWKCSGSNYSYNCVGVAPDNRGRKMTIKVNRKWKSEYNRDYKLWRKFKEKQRENHRF